MNVKVITHYKEEDVYFKDDYCDIEILIDGKPVIYFGDHYHDKGREKSKGFIEACLYFFPDVEIEKENVADRKL